MPVRASRLARPRRLAAWRRPSARAAAAALTTCVIVAATSAAAAPARAPAPVAGIFSGVAAAGGGYAATADTTWRWTGEDFDCHAQGDLQRQLTVDRPPARRDRPGPDRP